VRVALAVLLAAVLLAAVGPAVQDARRERAVGAVEADLAAVESAARSLAATDAAVGGVDGARRVVTVRVPRASATSAAVRYVAVGAVPGRDAGDGPNGDVVAVAVGDRPPVVVRLDVDLRIRDGDDRALRLTDPGRHRLAIRPLPGTDAVAVRRVDGRGGDGARAESVAAGSSAMRGPTTAMDAFAWLRGENERCGCVPAVDGDRLRVDAEDCPDGGDLAAAPACRRRVVEALSTRRVSAVAVSAAGLERVYDRDSAALLDAAGEFVERVGFHDEALADRAREWPLSAARDALARAGPVATVAEETLGPLAERYDEAAAALSPRVGLSMAGGLVDPAVPDDAELRDVTTLSTGDEVRLYDRPEAGVGAYHLDPVGTRLSASERRTLERARRRLGDGTVDGAGAPGRAVRAVADADDPVERLAGVLRRHTRGYGLVESLLADPAVSDVYATAPVERRPIRVVRDGETYRTNVRLTRDGARTVASRVRRASGRAFSRATPTVDASVETATGETVRVAGLADPVSDGLAFALRSDDGAPWTLPRLIQAGTVGAAPAALLSLAVRRDAAVLVAGPRGAGKTTTLGALLWELPAATRAVVIEDTPELPVDALGAAGRDVQRLRAAPEGSGPDPAAALRTALRLGEGALALGEVRGKEATTLFEAMRVGAGGSAVLGTVHGERATDVRDRVTGELGVDPDTFGAVDLVVTLGVRATDRGRRREVVAVEEPTVDGAFAPLYDRSDDERLTATGRVERGASDLIERLATTGESYAAVRDLLGERRDLLAELARTGRTGPDAVTTAYAREGEGKPC